MLQDKSWETENVEYFWESQREERENRKTIRSLCLAKHDSVINDVAYGKSFEDPSKKHLWNETVQNVIIGISTIYIHQMLADCVIAFVFFASTHHNSVWSLSESLKKDDYEIGKNIPTQVINESAELMERVEG